MRPKVRENINLLIRGGLGAVLFIATIWGYAILTGAGI